MLSMFSQSKEFSSKRTLYIFLGFFLFSLLLVGALFYPVLNKGQVPQEPSDSDQEESLDSVNGQSYQGKVIPLGASIYMQGTHRLVDKEGDLIILLETDDDKLEMAEGLWVEVTGRVRKTVEGDQEIMRVEEISLR